VENQLIYWANLNEPPSAHFTIQPLLKNIAKLQAGYKGGDYIACPAIRGKHSNTFFSSIPYDINVMFTNGQFFSSDTKITPRQGLYANSYAFNWCIERIFFSPIKQIMEVSPAYLHKTSYSQYGHAPSGAFDIGSWFRPSSPTFQLWTGEQQFLAKQGEAHLYFNFPSDNRIVLQEFFMNKDLFDIMNWCTNYKERKPYTPFKDIYRDFNNNNFPALIMNNITKNLVSPKL